MTDYTQATGQVHIDPALTLACVNASLAAYYDFDNVTAGIKHLLPEPDGFHLLSRFTGWDKLVSTIGEEERYGLFYRSTRKAGTYMVAFRGTASDMDALEDAWFKVVSFQPYKGSGFPQDVHVSGGFYSVYNDVGGRMTRSMRQQVFDLLSRASPAPTKVIVTGHSLGAALANLFMLDMAASLPNVATKSFTIASPRTGTAKWQAVYDTEFGLASRTYRIANYYDWVPSLPPALADYTHVGQRFLVAFYLEHDAYLAPLSTHSLLNYQTVLSNAVDATPQVWKGHFPDAVRTYFFHRMKSVVPDVSAPDPEWATAWREVTTRYRLEQSPD